MAQNITAVTPNIEKYLSAHFNAEDDFLCRLREEALEAGIPAINISAEQGAFIQLFLRSMQARYVLEVGSLAGYSAIMMARALPENGKVICIEVNPEYCEFIRRKARQAKLDHIIEVRCGSGIDVLDEMHLDYELDFAFIDADKPNYVNYLNRILPKLRNGGVVCGDNTLAWGYIAHEKTDFEPDNVYALQAFNNAIITNSSLLSCLVPLGDGMTLGYKLG